MRLLLQSISFGGRDQIKKQYPCENISHPFSRNYESADLKSFTIICEDIDKQDEKFIHRIIFNIAGDTKELLTGFTDLRGLPKGTKETANCFGKLD